MAGVVLVFSFQRPLLAGKIDPLLEVLTGESGIISI
jgi:hypothetical protein